MATVVSITNPITGLPEQVDKLDHTAQQIDDAVALAPQLSNPNLLDNWYFGNPVNQRGQTEYTAAGYTIDRWQFGSDADVKCVSVESGGVKISGSGGTYSNFEQILERLQAGTYTISFLVDDFKNVNQVYCPKANAANFTFYSNIVSLTFTLNADCEYISMGIQKKVASNALTVIAAKLEIGDRQTLAHQDANGNWVLNEVPDYGEQLRRCQRYAIDLAASEDRTYGIVGVGVAASQDKVQFMVPLPTTMRARPVAKFSGTWKFVHGTDTNGGVSVTAISVDRLSTNTVVLNTFTNANLLTVGDTYMLWRSDDSNNSLLLSADL